MKISYSIASTWWAGNIDLALAMLNDEHIERDLRTEKAFSYGQGFHKALELESKVTGRLPAIFNLPEFEVVGTEQKLYSLLPSGDTLSGVIDAIAVHPTNKMIVLADYKSGTHFDELQACVYHTLVHQHPWWLENIGDLQPSHFFFLTLDKSNNTTTNNIIQLSYPQSEEEWQLPEATTYTRGFNWIMTVIDDIKNNLGIGG